MRRQQQPDRAGSASIQHRPPDGGQAVAAGGSGCSRSSSSSSSRRRRLGTLLARPLRLVVLLLWLHAAHGSWGHKAGQGPQLHITKPMRDHLQQFAARLHLGKDYMGALSEQQRVAWSMDLGLTINDTLDALQTLTVPVTVDIKLVGFSGDGAGALHIGDHDLQLFLRTLHSQLDTVALHPSAQQLPIRPEFNFRVQPAYYELAPRLWAAINHGINTAHTSNYYGPYLLHLLPHDTVDALIAEDYASSGDGRYTLYLLNPPAHAPYAYAYPAGMPDTDSCPGSLWVSNSRYAWFDLSANLTFYGPGPGGKGQVFAHSTPVLAHYKPDSVSRTMLPDLAALVWSACQHLLWPPLHHGRLAHASGLDVHLVYMVEGLTRPAAGDGRVDVHELHQQLAELGHVVSTDVVVTEHFVLFGDCDHCMTAFAGSLKARTSRKAGSKEFKMAVSHFMDLSELERWLSEWRDALLSQAGVNWDDSSDRRMLPVFIFDLPSAEPILLDGLLQAAVLGSGDVVAVRSAAPSQPTFFGCFQHQMTLNPKAIHRPVLAAVLQAAFGVADTSLSWSSATGKGWSFLWSVGQTPFGVLANSATLSFVQSDAALRNLVLAYLNSSITHAAGLIEGFGFLAPPGAPGGSAQVKQFLQPEQVLPYQQRLALLLYKLRAAAQALGVHEHALALGYAASTAQDVAALHKITKHYKATLNPDLVCLGEPQQSQWWGLVAGCAFVTLVLVVWRCARGSTDGEEAEQGGLRSGAGSRRGSVSELRWGGMPLGGVHHRAH